MGTRKIDAPTSPITGNRLAAPKPIPSVPVVVSDEIPQQNATVKTSEPLQQKSELGKGITLSVLGIFVFLTGLFYGSSSKSAGNFDAFYQQMVLSNIMISLGVVILYHAVAIAGTTVVVFIRKRRGNL